MGTCVGEVCGYAAVWRVWLGCECVWEELGVNMWEAAQALGPGSWLGGLEEGSRACLGGAGVVHPPHLHLFLGTLHVVELHPVSPRATHTMLPLAPALHSCGPCAPAGCGPTSPTSPAFLPALCAHQPMLLLAPPGWGS